MTKVIKFYNSEVVRFSKGVEKVLESETHDICLKVLFLIRQLERGDILGMPFSRSMTGYPGLKELRVRDAAGILRIFYYFQTQHLIFILHAFRKKTQKTPVREIETALRRLQSMKEELHG